MKFVLPLALAAALVTSASANCAQVGNTQAENIFLEYDCLPDVSPKRMSSRKSLGCTGRQGIKEATNICKLYISRSFDDRCPSLRGYMQDRMQDECYDNVERAINGGQPNPPRSCGPGNSDYEEGRSITRNVGISCALLDFGEIEVNDELSRRRANNCVRRGAMDELDRIKRSCNTGPPPSPTRRPTRRRPTRRPTPRPNRRRPTTPPAPDACGKYTNGSAASQAAVNLVDDIFDDRNRSCRYATGGRFRSDAERELRNEFPEGCWGNAREANRTGRRAGEMKIQRIIDSCSWPQPSPTNPPTWPTRPPTRPRRITNRDIRDACGEIKNCNGCKKQCPGGDIKNACKDRHCRNEEMLEDEFEASLIE